MTPLLLATLALAATPAGDAATWVEPPAESLRAVYGLRYTRDYGVFELLKTNAEEWTIPLISQDRSRVYVGTRTGRLEALELRTGESLWKRPDMGAIGWGMAEFRGALVVGSDSSLVGLSQEDGAERWKVDLDGKLGAPLTITGTVALAPIRPNTVVAVDLVAGEILWRVKRPTPDGITVRGQAPVTVDEARGRAYLGFSDGALLSVRLEDGSTVWVATLGERREFFADVDVKPILVDGGKYLIAASYNGGLYELDAETGRTVWQQPLTRVVGLTRVGGGLLVATFGNGQVAGVYAKDGKVRWRYRAQRGFPTRPVHVGHGQVVFGISEGALTVLDAGTGRPLQLVDSGSGFSVPPDHHAPDLVALSNDGLLLVMRRGQGQGVGKD